MRQPPSAAPFVGRKSALVLLGCITLGWFSPVRAAPPSTPSPDQVKETVFWQQLYANGGHTLYCNHPFKDKTLLIDTDYIYPLRTMAHHLKCSSVQACTGNAQFQLMASDLHNMYPALKAVIRDRRNSLFGTTGFCQGQYRPRHSLHAHTIRIADPWPPGPDAGVEQDGSRGCE